MEKGTIGKIIDYYFSSPSYSGQIEGAMIEFFEVESMQTLRRGTIDEQELEFFCEWFVFDYKWNNNKTTLANFYHNNPLNLKQIDLQIYNDLQTNQYGMWEVISVDPGQGLRLENLQSGKKFDVKEYKATFELRPKDIFYNRLAFIGGHWEIVGANSFSLSVKFNKTVKEIWRKDKTPITPKDSRRIFASHSDDLENFDQNLPSMDEAEEKLAKMLKQFKIDILVTTELIKKWIYNLKRDTKSNSEIIDRLMGLVNFNELGDSLDINDLIYAFNDFYNLSPQKLLKDKSPSQLISEKSPSYEPDFEMNITPIGHGEDLDKLYEKAFNKMNSGDYYNALKSFDKCFKEFLKRRTTVFYIYRLYANKAVSHFACGQRAEGKKMVDIALELNPNYDFGQKLLRQYNDGEFDLDIKKILDIKLSSKYPKKDSSELYYDFLKTLAINFATPTLTTSEIRIFNPKGELMKVGRNDPCPCKAKHSDGRFKKFKHCHGR